MTEPGLPNSVERLRAASRMRDIAPFHVVELLTRARALEAAGREIVHMEVGEPDFPTPQPVIDAAIEFVRRGAVHYTPSLGLQALREAIAGFYRARYGLDVTPERIVVTAGASGALLLALGVLVEPGSEILLTDPGYPCNRHFVRAFEGRPRCVAVDAGTAFQLTTESIGANWSATTRGVLVASPANPTGTMIEPAALRGIAESVRHRGGMLIVDEIYHGLTYGFDAESALALGDDIFIVNSFSKYFGMTGWRLGWLVCPPGLVREVEKLAQNLFISPSAPAQAAALAAFAPANLEILEGRRSEFAARRDLLLPGLRDLGFIVAAEPRGAFYVYADIQDLADDGQSLAHALLEQAGVAITPGIDFGEHRARTHVRFAYTTSRNRIETGLARLRSFLRAGA